MQANGHFSHAKVHSRFITYTFTNMRLASVLLLFVLMASCTVQSAEDVVTVEFGPDARLADGPVVSYASHDPSGSPIAIGVRFAAKALDTLPASMSDRHHCYDRDGNATIDPDTECIATHERVMPLPSSTSSRSDIPFKWVLLNWNPMGHIPPGIYDKPHFDIHFMIDPIERIFSIESGACGPEFVRCDQFEVARKEVPPPYIAADYQNFDAVVPAMGNHLIDVTSSELHGEPFTRTWIFGAYDGRITFYEEMVTVDYLKSRPDTCFAVKQPPAVEIAGYYPTESCLRYDASADAYTVSMESFIHREATPKSATALTSDPAPLASDPAPLASDPAPLASDPAPAAATSHPVATEH